MNQNRRRLSHPLLSLPSETIALLLAPGESASATPADRSLEQVLEPRYLAWLTTRTAPAQTSTSAANPLRAGSRKRTKECIASVRHLYIDIDTDGDARLAALRASDRVPTPTAILSTSPGKYQVLWRVDGFDFEQQEQTLKLLAIAFGGDPACTDRNRVLRVPGFFNQKYSPAHLVAVEYPADPTYGPADFRLDEVAGSSVLPLRGNARESQPGKHSHSEHDWAWVCNRLAHGLDAAKLTHELASRRADKADPLYYAAAHRRCRFGPPLARRWHPHRRRYHHARSPPPLRDSRRTLLRSCAGDCGHRSAHDCPSKDGLIPQSKENPMPLLEVTQTRYVSASVRLTDTTALQLDQYAAFIHATADEVIDQALAYVFSKDRDFQEFLKSPQAQRITPTLRVRRVPASDAAEQPNGKPAHATESSGSVRVPKA